MILLEANNKAVTSEISEKIAGMQKVLMGFAQDGGDVVSDVAKKTIFGGVGTPSLKVRTGETQKTGLSVKHFNKFKTKINYAGEAFWSRMTNIFDNRKDGTALGLLKALRKEVSKDSVVQKIFDQAMDDFDKVGKK